MPVSPQTQLTLATRGGGCCSCMNIAFLSTLPGLCKLGEVIFGGICLGLTVTYGTPVWLFLGSSYGLFLTSSASSLMGASTTMLSYVLSSQTFKATRTTILETVQNTLATILYAGSSSFLLVQCSFILWPMYLIIPYFQAYPAMMAAGILGATCAVIHGVDAYSAYQTYKSR